MMTWCLDFATVECWSAEQSLLCLPGASVLLQHWQQSQLYVRVIAVFCTLWSSSSGVTQKRGLPLHI
jgi:hypothetical protein